MIILDENIRDDQEELLLKKRIRVRRVGREFGRLGMDDSEIIPLLHALPKSTLFTHDVDFYRPRLAHRNYCLVHLNVADRMAANYIRRVLRHAALDTKTKRMGAVIQVHGTGLAMWRIGEKTEIHLEWA